MAAAVRGSHFIVQAQNFHSLPCKSLVRSSVQLNAGQYYASFHTEITSAFFGIRSFRSSPSVSNTLCNVSGWLHEEKNVTTSSRQSYRSENVRGQTAARATLASSASSPKYIPLYTVALVAFSLVRVLLKVFRQGSLQGKQSKQLRQGKDLANGGSGDADWLPQEQENIGKQLLHQGGLGLALLTASMPNAAREHFSPLIAGLRANPTFMSALIAWTLAQVLKVFTTYAVERRWDPKMLMGSGGMPSSHSALCLALTTSVALTHGVTGPLFPVCLGFSLIVMYDATGVRYHAGMQAEVLNVIVQDLFQGHPVSQKKLKELLGHTPLQVGAGAVLGAVVSYFYNTSTLAAVVV
eukprot:jgi/Mesen1/8669/ME000504S08103